MAQATGGKVLTLDTLRPGDRVRVRHRGKLLRGVYVFEGWDEGDPTYVWLRREQMASGRMYRAQDIEIEPSKGRTH